jgi:hypothetical protein
MKVKRHPENSLRELLLQSQKAGLSPTLFSVRGMSALSYPDATGTTRFIVRFLQKLGVYRVYRLSPSHFIDYSTPEEVLFYLQPFFRSPGPLEGSRSNEREWAGRRG